MTKRYDVDLATASDILALERIHHLAMYREHLEAMSARLAVRIRSIGTDERVLIISDNDEDGVASAAIMHRMITCLNPGAGDRIIHVNESFRSPSVPDLIQQMQDTDNAGATGLRVGPCISHRRTGANLRCPGGATLPGDAGQQS